MLVNKRKKVKKVPGMIRIGKIKNGGRMIGEVVAPTIKGNPKNKVKVIPDPPVGKVRMSPVFRSKEQEELFARCAEKSMSTTAILKW